MLLNLKQALFCQTHVKISYLDMLKSSVNVLKLALRLDFNALVAYCPTTLCVRNQKPSLCLCALRSRAHVDLLCGLLLGEAEEED